MQRSLSMMSDAAAKMSAFRVAPLPGGVTLDGQGLPVSWESWQHLVAWVVWQNSPDVSRSFVFSYRLVINDALKLIELLLEICSLPFKWITFEDEIDPMIVRTSVLSFIKLWIELAFRDFGPKTFSALLDGLKGLVSPSTLNQYKLLGLKRGSFQPLQLVDGEASETFPSPCPVDALEMESFGAAVVVVARMIFLEMTADSLLMNSASSVHKHFNRLSNFASSWVLAESDRKAQLRCMKYLVEVAAYTFNHHDLLSSMALAAGLSCHDVSRLRLAEELPEMHRSTIVRLEELLSGANNYSLLRSAEKLRFELSFPTVPYVPMHLRDVITVSETGGKQTFEQLYFRGVVSCDLLLQQRHVSTPSAEVLQSAPVLLVINLPFCSEGVRAKLSDAHRELLLTSNSLPSVGAEVSRKSLLVEKPKKLAGNDLHRSIELDLKPARKSADVDLKPTRKSVDADLKPIRTSAESESKPVLKRVESVSNMKKDAEVSPPSNAKSGKAKRLTLTSQPTVAASESELKGSVSPKEVQSPDGSLLKVKRLTLSSPTSLSPETKSVTPGSPEVGEGISLKKLATSDALSSYQDDSSEDRANAAFRAEVFQSMVSAKSDDVHSSSQDDDNSGQMTSESTTEENSKFWESSQKRWKSKLQLIFTDAAIRGAEAATGEARNGRRKARSYLSQLGKFFRKKGRPIVNLTETMKGLVVKDHVLFFDPDVLRDSSNRCILLMQPAKYFPGATPHVEMVDLLMAYAQLMFATTDSYVFVADMRNWGPSNFSVPYAAAWFFAMQSLPLPITHFVLVEPQPYFKTAFKLFSPFLSRPFQAKFKFASLSDLKTAFSFELGGVPQLFGGALKLDFEASFNKLTSFLTSRDFRRNMCYFSAFASSVCERCNKNISSKHVHSGECTECRRTCCEGCLINTHLESLGEKGFRLICEPCVYVIQEVVEKARNDTFPHLL